MISWVSFIYSIDWMKVVSDDSITVLL